MKNVKDINFSEKKVIIRCDFNVPIENGKIIEDQRIEESLKTINYILEQKPGLLLIISHLGRPKGKNVPELSLEPIQRRLAELVQREVFLIKTLDELAKTREGNSEQIYLLENIRFWAEEEDADDDFARKITEGFDVYVSEAFSASHRDHSSISRVPEFVEEKCAGILFKNELDQFMKIKNPQNHPAVAIVGGAKIETKLPVIKNLEKNYEHILVGGIIANEALDQGLEFGEKVLLPTDFKPDEKSRLDIGPKTIDEFKEKIKEAKTIVWNGPLGKFEDEEYAIGTKEIIDAIVSSKATYKLAGGGESIEAIKKFSDFSKFDYVSMSGGAMLEFLAGKELPGISALN
jgi:phosphoglycerate kinase